MPCAALSLAWPGAPRAARATLAAAASMLALTGAAAGPATLPTPPRAGLPSPNPAGLQGTPTALDPTQQLALRVYLSGRHPARRVAATLAVSDPRSPAYAHYLTPAQYQLRYGPTAAQTGTVTRWLASLGMKITATTRHYIAVQATVAQADTAFGTRISDYVYTVTINGRTVIGHAAGAAGGFSVPAALRADVATVTGIAQAAVGPGAAGAQAARNPVTTPAAPAASANRPGAASGYHCSQYWGQHTEAIPQAYGHLTAPTQLCGYTPAQLRQAYGITSSPDTGQGATIAIVLDGNSPTMLADANRFFTRHGLAGFAPGQYVQNADSTEASSCSSITGGDQPEQAIDVETAHIAAPAAKIVYVAADCDPTTIWTMQDLLDAETRVADQHLANVVSSSWGLDESVFSPADTAAWDLTFQQGALEGIGFDFSSGDAGASITTPFQPTASVQFPASDPWATTVGGTSLSISQNGRPADYAWGDNGTQINAAGTGYTPPPPGMFLQGSGGGVSALFPEPRYQKSAVPAALAAGNGTGPPRRVIPDIAANAGSLWLIGYTGAVTPGVYSEVTGGGGTSGAAPLIAGLEADAMQAAGRPLGFANPALYRLRGSPAIDDVPPVNPADPPMVIGGQSFLGPETNYLTTLGEDQPPLQETAGYDDVTGLGTPSGSFVTAFGRR